MLRQRHDNDNDDDDDDDDATRRARCGSEAFPPVRLGDLEAVLPILAAVRRDAGIAPHACPRRGANVRSTDFV